MVELISDHFDTVVTWNVSSGLHMSVILYQTHVRLHLIVHNFMFRHMHHTADLFWSQFVCPLMYSFTVVATYVIDVY